jgi:two-component system sensor histidine kinase YesM
MKFSIKNLFSSLFFQFTLIVIVIWSIPIMYYQGFLYKKSADTISQQSISYSEELLRQVSVKVDVLVEDINMLTILPYYFRTSSYRSIQDFLSEKYESDREDVRIDNRSEYKVLEELLEYTLGTKDHIKTVLITTKSGHVFYLDKRGDYLVENYAIQDKDWFKQITSRPTQLTILSTHKQEYFSLQRPVITFARNILDTKKISANMSDMITATLLIDVNIDLLAKIGDSSSNKKQGEIMILDEVGRIVYGKDSNELGNELLWFATVRDNVKEKHGYFSMVRNEEKTIVNYYNNKTTGWTILNIVDQNELLGDLNHLKQVNLMFITLLLLQFFVLLLLFYYRVSSPMREILNVMKRVEGGDLDNWISIKSRTELGRIGLGLNRMMGNLKHYIHRNFLIERKQKEAELDALKNQINPHFLYNTLEAIRMSALLSKAPDIAEMISSLSSQFQYAVSRGKDIVPIREEIDNVENYFSLLKIRYRDKINLVIQINEHILNVYTLRLTLQPIVENAVLHGILKKEERGLIRIYEQTEEDYFNIIIQDDGIGMDDAQVEELSHMLSNMDTDHSEDGDRQSVSRIGLKNVHDRIRMYFGEPYGISIVSQKNVGTQIIVMLPYLD